VTWTHKVQRKLTVNLGDGDLMIVRYNRSGLASWYNVMQLLGTRIGYKGKSKHWTFYPEATKNHLKVGALYLEWLLRERGARGGQWSRPLT
jgi:hypothetical protein